MQRRRTPILGPVLGILLGLALCPNLGAADTKKAEGGLIPGGGPGPIQDSVWKNASKKPVTSAEIDALIGKALAEAGVKPAPVASDEQFLRRVSLDLCGRPPSLAELRAFLEDRDPNKRAKVIDKLLESDEYAKHWARYWYDVMSARLVNNFQSRALSRSFDRWMTDQLKKNANWADVTRQILTASGQARFDDTEGKSGAAFFLASHMGADSVPEQAAETARVFLGIQINCAQCHNHPFDVWKREQFHELAAYFARVRTRLVRDTTTDSKQVRFIGVELVSADRGMGMGFGGGGFGRMGGGGEYRMPDKNNPRTGTVMHPRSLDGKAPAHGLKDSERRKALADSIVAPENHWFAAAYVNRVWGVLLGQGFYQPVDDLGPQREAVHGAVLARLAASFSANGHDMKGFFRVVLNSQTYQRQSKLGDGPADHLLFAASYPARLRPSALWGSLDNAIGPFPAGAGLGGRRGPFAGMMAGAGGFGLEGMIRSEFSFDPSSRNEDVEGSIPQALTLMNNPQLNNRTRATVAKLVGSQPNDEKALEELYLRVLCRKPTASEQKKCLAFLTKTDNRAEAFEDVLWALLNSTEFQTRR